MAVASDIEQPTWPLRGDDRSGQVPAQLAVLGTQQATLPCASIWAAAFGCGFLFEFVHWTRAKPVLDDRCSSMAFPIADLIWQRDNRQMGGDSLNWLTNWYLSQCNGDWEHSYGLKIGTLDNPGWSIKIDLADTPLAGRTFECVVHGAPGDHLEEWQRPGSWLVVSVKDGAFYAACGPLDLFKVIDIFRAWAELHASF